MQAKLTNQAIKALAATGAEYVCWDTVLKRFGVKVTKLGTKSFIVQYRTGGRGSPSRRVTIGEPGDASWTVEKARKEAGIILGKVDAGVDPFAEKKAAEEAERQAREEEKHSRKRAFSDVVDTYTRRRLSKQARGQLVEQLLRREFVSTWGQRDIATIGRNDVKAVLSRLQDAGKDGAAREALKRIRPLFEFAVDESLMPANPAAGIRLDAPYVPKERFLSDDELREVWHAAVSRGYPFGQMAQLLILTAQRRAEVTGARWSEFDLNANIWTIPAGRTKNRKEHIVHLSEQARSVLDAMPRQDSEYLFTTTMKTPVSGFSRAKALLDDEILKARRKVAERAGEAVSSVVSIDEWDFHDFRRTFATGAARLKIDHMIADRVLNHVPKALSGVARIYNKFEYLDERKAAMDTWGAHVEALINSHAN
ncbi:MAG TPA: tyrosine-type recombinase/integrase [Magnetospirillum sp.]|nr:tyrosine-type recombinase/integrase [Magnetospirillum sp.]